MAKLSDLALTSTDPNSYIDEPTAMERIGRGMTDLLDPVQSLYYGITNAAKQKQFDAQRQADEAMYLQGLWGDSVPAQLRAAAPDFWRSMGQELPFLAAAPSGMLASGRAAAMAGAGLAASSTVGQPLLHPDDIYDYIVNGPQMPGQ